MKRIIIILATLLVVTGCTKDPNPSNDNPNDSLTISETSVSLFKDDEYTIQAASNSPISYSSDNEYHATVSPQGIIKARFVGTTTINVSNASDTKHITIDVKPRFNQFTAPNITFGDSREAVVAAMGEPDYSQFNGKVYGYYFNGNYPDCIEVHFQDDKVSEYEAIFTIPYDEEAKGYISERFKYQYTHLTTDYYINALETVDATMLVGSYEINARYWGIIFKPYNQ